MPIIREDAVSLYVRIGGHIARPVYPTSFVKGDSIKGRHLSQSIRVGMGPRDSNGDYQEYWTTTGIESFELKNLPVLKIQQSYDYYKMLFKSLYKILEVKNENQSC